MPENTPRLPYFHDFYSATWTQGDEQSPLRTGPVQNERRPWNDGALLINDAPGIPLGTFAQFEGILEYPADVNTSVLRAGIPSRCWTDYGFPLAPVDAVTNLKNCCVRTAYARVIQLVYDEDWDTITQFFQRWLGVGVTIATYPEAGLLPAMLIIGTNLYTLVFVSGTTSYQQYALQAWESRIGPSNVGAIRTLPLWNRLADTIFTRLQTLAVDITLPLVLSGHSYGGAGCALVAIRKRLAQPFAPIFLLTFGMPRPSDFPGIRVLDEVDCVHVFNRGDFVCQLPPNVIQSSWFPEFIGQQLETNWGLWSAAREYRIQELDGSSHVDHLPALTEDVLAPLVWFLFTFEDTQIIQPHRIAEYVLRSCRGCNCPRWPFDEGSWAELAMQACGSRGFRWRADVPFRPIRRGIPGAFRFRGSVENPTDVRGRFRFAALVRGPVMPSNVWQLCLLASSSQYAVGPNIPQIEGAGELTIMFWGTRGAANDPVIVSQAYALMQGRVEVLMWSDGNIYWVFSTDDDLRYAVSSGCNDALPHHIAAVFDGSGATDADRLKAFIDGFEIVLTFSTSIPNVIGTRDNAMHLGWEVPNNTYQTGDLDDVAVFSFPMSATAIARIAARQADPSWWAPVLLLRFEEGTGTVAHDSSGYGNTFNLINGAGFCWTGNLPQTAARFRFRSSVAHVIPPGPPIAGRFRWRASVNSIPIVGDPVVARFKFSSALWVSPTLGSTRSLRFRAPDLEFAEFTSLGGFSHSGFTLCFWSRWQGPPMGGSISLHGPDDSVLELRVEQGPDGPGSITPVVLFRYFNGIETIVFEGRPLAQTSTLLGFNHFAVVLHAPELEPRGMLRLYINGVYNAFDTSYGDLPYSLVHSDQPVLVCKSDAGLYGNCLVDDVAILSIPLDEEQVFSIATAQVDVGTFNPFGLLRFEEDVDNLLWDTAWADLDHAIATFGIEHSDDVPPLFQ